MVVAMYELDEVPCSNGSRRSIRAGMFVPVIRNDENRAEDLGFAADPGLASAKVVTFVHRRDHRSAPVRGRDIGVRLVPSVAWLNR